MFKNLVKILGKLSRIHIEAQSLPNLMVSRALYMHSQLAQAIENALFQHTLPKRVWTVFNLLKKLCSSASTPTRVILPRAAPDSR